MYTVNFSDVIACLVCFGIQKMGKRKYSEYFDQPEDGKIRTGRRHQKAARNRHRTEDIKEEIGTKNTPWENSKARVFCSPFYTYCISKKLPTELHILGRQSSTISQNI